MKKYLVVYCILFGWICSVQAQEDRSRQFLDLSVKTQPHQSYIQLAQLEATNIDDAQMAHSGEKPPLFKSRPLTLNKVHKYLGYASMVSAVLTGLSPKTAGGPHELFGTAAAAFGAAAVLSGFAFHYEDISLKGGFGDPDNLHMLLGILGTAGYAVAVSSGEKGGHGGPGTLGALSMAMAIKLTW